MPSKLVGSLVQREFGAPGLQGAINMACGNNHVSRDHLSSPPEKPSDIAARAKAAAERLRTAERIPEYVRIPGRSPARTMVEAYLSQYDSKTGKIDYFLDGNGEKTSDPNLHVHVIHDENNGEVKLLLTDRQTGAKLHTEKIPLQNPSGREVHAEEVRLTGLLRERAAKAQHS